MRRVTCCIQILRNMIIVKFWFTLWTWTIWWKQNQTCNDFCAGRVLFLQPIWCVIPLSCIVTLLRFSMWIKLCALDFNIYLNVLLVVSVRPIHSTRFIWSHQTSVWDCYLRSWHQYKMDNVVMFLFSFDLKIACLRMPD